MVRARVLLVLLLLALLPVRSFAEDPKPPAEPEWSSTKTEELLALAKAYLTKDTRREREEVLAKARKLGAIPDRPMKKLVKELFKVARSVQSRSFPEIRNPSRSSSKSCWRNSRRV